MSTPERPPSFGWSILATVVVIAALFLFVGAVIGIIAGFLKLVVLVLLCVLVIGWATGRKANR
jgi:hypothetical protein